MIVVVVTLGLAVLDHEPSSWIRPHHLHLLLLLLLLFLLLLILLRCWRRRRKSSSPTRA